jgi:subtilisin family serine protease
MNRSPHASFSLSFTRKTLLNVMLIAGITFGVINVLDASALNVSSSSSVDTATKSDIAIKEKRVEPLDEGTQPDQSSQLPINYAKELSSSTKFSSLDYSSYSETFKPISNENFRTVKSEHLSAIDGIRNATASNSPINGEGVVVGIIDSGLNTNENNFIDRNGNSRIVKQSCFGAVAEIAPCDQRSPANLKCSQMVVGCYHGNAVADLLAGNRYSQVLESGEVTSSGGVAPSAKISFARITLNANGELDEKLFVDALNSFLVDVKAGKKYAPKVINISIGFPREGKFKNCEAPSAIKSIIDSLNSRGVSIVVASGNSGAKNEIMFPACLNNVISVGSTQFTKDNKNRVISENISNYSQSSNELDVVAPGTDLNASTPSLGLFNKVRGTSFASPLVSGTIALLLQVNPNLTPSQIRHILISNGDRVNDHGANLNVARINVFKSLLAINGKVKHLSAVNS